MPASSAAARKARNKASAALSRERARLHTASLEEAVAALTAEKLALAARVRALEAALRRGGGSAGADEACASG